MKKPRRRWLLAILVAVPVLVLLGMVTWAVVIPPPMGEALEALDPGGDLSVETEPWLVFRPEASDPDVGLVFYPGARVDYRAYAPAARAIAENGYLVVVPPAPLNLPVLAPDVASRIQTAFPEIDHWAVGGHSLGGAMAAQYAAQNPEKVEGLILWAAYPPASSDLSHVPLSVVSVFASLDGLASPGEIIASRDLLPDTTRWVEIVGGNHAQFGWYGPQSGDNTATISRPAQQQQAIAATLDLLRSLDPSNSSSPPPRLAARQPEAVALGGPLCRWHRGEHRLLSQHLGLLTGACLRNCARIPACASDLASRSKARSPHPSSPVCAPAA
jgi:dienelactone hydrolase